MRPSCKRCLCLISTRNPHTGLSWWSNSLSNPLCSNSWENFPWFNLLVCSTNLHIWSDIRDTLNELQLSNKLLQLDLKGFSQASPDIHFPLSPFFQGLLENKWLVLFQMDRFSYLMLLFLRNKRKWKLLSSPRILNPEQTEAFCLSLE
jgi:hypothetical protein